MRKKMINHGIALVGIAILAFLSIASGATTPPAIAEVEQKPGYQWIIGQFTNEWNDELGIYYTKFTGSCEGVFSNTWDSNKSTTINGVRFSKEEGLRFETSNEVSFQNENVDVTVRHSDGTEYNFAGQYVKKNSSGIIVVFYSDELLDSLLGENITIRFITASKFYRCQFNFPPRFDASYEELKQKFST